MKRIAELSSLTRSLKIARIVFFADLLLMAPVMYAGEIQAADTTSSVSSNNVISQKKEARMNTASKSLKTLVTLSQNKIDQVFLLEQAIDDIKHDDIKKQLASYKENLEGQIQTLANLIKDLGGEPPKYSSDLKTLFNQSWEKIRGFVGGDEGEIKALCSNIEKILEKEEDALRADWPPNSKSVLQSIADATKKLKDYLSNEAIPQSRVAAAS